MAEWSIAAVLKTVELRGSGGSNPSLSAKEQKNIRSAFRAPYIFLFINTTVSEIYKLPSD